MADFVQTMKGWRRMCQHMDKVGGDRSCDICPLGGCNAIYEEDGSTDYANVEEKVAAWAAEHPEPVYPTWEEYLVSKGLLKPYWNENGTAPYDMYKYAELALSNTIPADIAQKLGLEPKEG